MSSPIPQVQTITYEQFTKVGLTVAYVWQVNAPEESDPIYHIFWLYLGEALFTKHHRDTGSIWHSSPIQLSEITDEQIQRITHRQIVCVYNLPRPENPKSDCLVLGAARQAELPEPRQDLPVFITPSPSTQYGRKIGLLGEDGFSSTDERELTEEQFAALDLRVGTITAVLATARVASLVQIHFAIDLGDAGRKVGVGLASKSLGLKLPDSQVVVLTNLDPRHIQAKFKGSEATVVLCTIQGTSVLSPSQPVENGYKIK